MLEAAWAAVANGVANLFLAFSKHRRELRAEQNAENLRWSLQLEPPDAQGWRLATLTRNLADAPPALVARIEVAGSGDTIVAPFSYARAGARSPDLDRAGRVLRRAFGETGPDDDARLNYDVRAIGFYARLPRRTAKTAEARLDLALTVEETQGRRRRYKLCVRSALVPLTV